MKKIVLILILMLQFVPRALSVTPNPLQNYPTATVPAGDDWIYLSGATNSVRKLSPLYYEPALGNPGSSGYILASTSGGTRSWVAPGEPVLGNPSVSGYVLASTTGGTRSWVPLSFGSIAAYSLYSNNSSSIATPTTRCTTRSDQPHSAGRPMARRSPRRLRSGRQTLGEIPITAP